MITMDQYEQIRTYYFVLKKSCHEINRELGFHRNTIRKAVAGVTPGYRRTAKIVSPMMDIHLQVLREWLILDLSGPKRERHTAKKAYARLVNERGYTGCEGTVRDHIRKIRKSLEEERRISQDSQVLLGE